MNVKETLIEEGYKVASEGEIMIVELKNTNSSILIVEQKDTLFFELDMINISNLKDEKALLVELLELNNEVPCVSIGLNEGTIVINENLFTENLDSNELLGTIEAIELTVPKLCKVIEKYMEVK